MTIPNGQRHHTNGERNTTPNGRHQRQREPKWTPTTKEIPKGMKQTMKKTPKWTNNTSDENSDTKKKNKYY